MIYKDVGGELKASLGEWVRILHLEAWNIRAFIQRRRDMPDQQAQGYTSYSFERRTAAILILDPMDYDDELFEQDMEQTLVHELMHLVLEVLTPENKESLEYAMLEQIVDSMATTLVKLKRGGTKLPETKQLKWERVS